MDFKSNFMIFNGVYMSTSEVREKYYNAFHYNLVTVLIPKENGEYDLTTIVERTVEFLCKYGLKNVSSVQNIAGIWVYPKEYFCPKDYFTGKLEITKNTYSIHWYDASWVPRERRFKNWLYTNSITSPIMRFFRKYKKI